MPAVQHHACPPRPRSSPRTGSPSGAVVVAGRRQLDDRLRARLGQALARVGLDLARCHAVGHLRLFQSGAAGQREGVSGAHTPHMRQGAANQWARRPPGASVWLWPER